MAEICSTIRDSLPLEQSLQLHLRQKTWPTDDIDTKQFIFPISLLLKQISVQERKGGTSLTRGPPQFLRHLIFTDTKQSPPEQAMSCGFSGVSGTDGRKTDNKKNLSEKRKMENNKNIKMSRYG